MFILYRYLLRQFLQIFLICFCSMDGLYIVIDAFTNLEEFISYGERHGGVFAVIGKYYVYRSLSFFDATSGIVALIAAMFTLAMFQRFNELTALLAAGISQRRIIKPIVYAALVISLLAAASRELVIPRVRDKLALDSHDLGGERAKELRPKRDDSTDILLRGKQTVAKARQIIEPNFMLPQSLDAPYKQLQAADAYYLPADAKHPSGYLMTGLTQPKDLAKRPSLLDKNGKPLVLSPHDYHWLKEDQCFVPSDITFEQLVGADDWLRYASFLELVAGLRNRSLALGADVAVAIHARPLQPLLDMTLLFLGLPLMLQRGKNVFAAIGMCVGLVVAFLMLVMGAQYLGSSYWISPSLAAWLPLMVFVPLAIAMSDPLRE
jgi:lipopolysaccharide export system permease protein